MKQNTIIVGVIILLGVLAVISGFIVLRDFINLGKTEVTFAIAPQDVIATDQDDNKYTLQDGKTIKLAPGTYSFTFEKENFNSTTEEIVVPESKPIIHTIVLEAANEAGTEELASEVNITVLDGIGQYEMARQEDAAEQYPFIAELPFEDESFSISYTFSVDGEPTLLVDAKEGSRADVIQQIWKWGYDPSEYRIKFTESRNPFNE